MTKRTLIIISLLAAYAASVSCVDHRPLRTEVFNEEIYLPKDFLTRENPNRKDTGDHAWLYKVTVLQASNPDLGMDGLLFPGENSNPRYVRFQFKPKHMEMVDGTEYSLNTDKDGKPVASDSLAAAALNVWSGSHVDIKMKDNMDGERTNVIEENKEAPWQQRQYFKVDFEKAAVADVNMISWYKTDLAMGDCFTLRSVSLVPDSFKIEKDATKTGADKGDDYFTYKVQLTYEARLSGGYYCGDQIADAMDRHTFTYTLKYFFWRPPDNSDYLKNRAIEMKEKDPIKRTVGAFETGWGRLSVYYDKKTALPGAKSWLLRLDPDKPKHTFYFSSSYPEQGKKHMINTIAPQFNGLMKKVGAKLRIEFKDHDWECKDNDESTKCIERTFGDMRYSFLIFHDVPLRAAPGGMVYFDFDPRTGEIYNTGFNVYDYGSVWFTWMIQDYLQEVTGDDFKDKNTACTPGDVIKVDPKLVATKFKYTSLYNKLESYMNQTADKWVPQRSDNFGKYLRMLMPELRFYVPWWNDYVNKGTMPDQLDKMSKLDREFHQQNNDIDRGKSPFGSHSIHSNAGIEQGLKHINAFKAGARNHRQLTIHREMRNAHRLMCNHDHWELVPAMVRNGRMCKSNKRVGDPRGVGPAHRRRLVQVFATHEFGHTLSLRHNFYGSVDKPHFANNGKDLPPRSWSTPTPSPKAPQTNQVQALGHDGPQVDLRLSPRT